MTAKVTIILWHFDLNITLTYVLMDNFCLCSFSISNILLFSWPFVTLCCIYTYKKKVNVATKLCVILKLCIKLEMPSHLLFLVNIPSKPDFTALTKRKSRYKIEMYKRKIYYSFSLLKFSWIKIKTFYICEEYIIS